MSRSASRQAHGVASAGSDSPLWRQKRSTPTAIASSTNRPTAPKKPAITPWGSTW
jgi:hypothetical protein